MRSRSDREIQDGLTEEDAAIFHSHGLGAYRACRQDFDGVDYRAMLAREEHRADGRAPGASERRPGQWVSMVEALRTESRS